MKKRVISLFLAVVMIVGMLPLGAIPGFAAEEKVTALPTVPGTVLTDGYYVVSADTTITGAACQSALVISGDVIIFINEGCTLTVVGGNASGTNGAGAGIEVPEGSSLTICGNGTLNATGGNASNGVGGKNGESALIVEDDSNHDEDDWCYSGAGGKGGAGGGGAAAGIGGKGGNGGAGGDGGEGLSREADGSTVLGNGNDGKNGKPGTAGAACGDIAVCDTVTVNANGGSVSGNSASGGVHGYIYTEEWYFYYRAFGGGGGGAGGNGYAGAKIGSGGSGGSGGGGGGSGIIDYFRYEDDLKKCQGTGLGGEGGYGGIQGGKGGELGASHDTTDGYSAGNGGKSGAAGTNGAEKQNVYLKSVTVSSAVQGLIYNQETQTGVTEDTGYTLSGNTAVNAGAYTATATLNSGYCWSDGTIEPKTINWSIAKKKITVPAARSFDFTDKEIAAFEETELYTVTNEKATAVGKYTAVFDLKDKTNYEWENTVTAETEYDIHKFKDGNGDGICDICPGNIHYVYDTPYLDRIVNDDNTVSTLQKTCIAAYHIAEADTVWGADDTTWYVLDKSVTLKNRPEVKGDVRIILTDGCTLSASNGITLEEGNTLTVYAQSDDEAVMGKLNVITDSAKTAIGGQDGRNGQAYSYAYGEDGGHGTSAGALCWKGGSLTVTAPNATCIGGGDGGDGATASVDPGAGGNGGSSADVSVYGGVISLNGASGISGGNGGKSGNALEYTEDGGWGGNGRSFIVYEGIVTIHSTKGVCVGGGSGGAGGVADHTSYGGGVRGPGGSGGAVTVFGGTVTLTSEASACIGGGSGLPNGSNATVTVSGSLLMKAGDDADSALTADGYDGQKYLSVEQDHKHTCENTVSYDKSTGIYTVTEKCQNCDYSHAYTFTPYDYIAAEKGAYINTGYKPTGDTRVVMDVYVNGAKEYWFGMWDNNYNDRAFAFGNDGYGVYAGYGNNGGTFGNVVTTGRHTVELDKGKVKVDGKAVCNWDQAEFSLDHALYLFAQNRVGNAVTHGEQNTIHCYGCEIYEGDTLVRKFVPVKNCDEASGLLDTVNGVFYANNGSAAMTAKNDTVETVSEQAATCTENGHIAYYKRGFKYYTNEACTNEITDLSAWLSTSVENGGGMTEPATGHSFTYTVSDHTVTAKCSGCDAEKSTTLTVPGFAIYDGSEKTATIEGRDEFVALTGASVGKILYSKDGTNYSENAPVNAGEYNVKATVAGEVMIAVFKINKACPAADDFSFIPPESCVYDGQPKQASVTTDKDGMGEITVKYQKQNGDGWDTAAAEAPAEAGKYKVVISVEEGENYAASAADISSDSWVFEITAPCAHESTTVSYVWGSNPRSCTASLVCDSCHAVLESETLKSMELSIRNVPAVKCTERSYVYFIAEFENELFGSVESEKEYFDPGPHHYIDYVCEYCGDEDFDNAQSNAIKTIDNAVDHSDDEAIILIAENAVNAINDFRDEYNTVAEVLKIRDLTVSQITAIKKINAAAGNNLSRKVKAIIDIAKEDISSAESIEDVETIHDECLADIEKLTGTAHEHTFSTEWSYNETHHWHNATCVHTGLTSGFGAHTFGEGVTEGNKTTYTCTECGYTKFVYNTAGDEEGEIITGISYSGISLTLGSDIYINFYMNLNDGARQNGKMTFDIGGRIVTVDGKDAKYNEKEGKYYFRTPLTALEMAETVKATFSYNGVDYIQEYSVVEYIEAIVGGGDKYTAEMKTLAKKIANYGYYAQIYLESIHSNVDIVDSGIGYDRMECFGGINVEEAKKALADHKTTVTGSSANLSLYGTTVYFDSATALNYYVTAKNGEKPTAAAVNTATGKSKEVEIKLYRKNIYIVSVKDITATELADNIEVTVNGEITFSGSVFAYCNSVVQAHTFDGATEKDAYAVNAMAAFYEYYEAAMEYISFELHFDMPEHYKVFTADGEEIKGDTTVKCYRTFSFRLVPDDNYKIGRVISGWDIEPDENGLYTVSFAGGKHDVVVYTKIDSYCLTVTVEGEDASEMPDTKISFVCNGDETIYARCFTPGIYEIEIPKGKSGTIVVEKSGYQKYSQEFTADGLTDEITVELIPQDN